MDSIDENIYVSTTHGEIMSTPSFFSHSTTTTATTTPSITESVSSSVSSATSSLSSAMDHGATRISDSMHDIRDSTAHRMHDLRDSTSHRLHDVSTSLHNAKETVKSSLNSGLSTMKTEVKETESTLSDKLHHAGDVVKAHMPSIQLTKESKPEAQHSFFKSTETTTVQEPVQPPVAVTPEHHTQVDLAHLDASKAPAYTLGEKLDHWKSDIVQGIDHMVHPSHNMHPPHITKHETKHEQLVQPSYSESSSTMELHANDISTPKPAEIPIASYPPQPDAAPNADPTLEYSLPATASKSSEHGLMDNLKEDYRSVKDKLHDLSDKITHPLHDMSDKILHPSGAANTQSRAEHLTTIHSTKTEVKPLSHDFSTSKSDNSTGGSWGFTKEASMRDNELSEKEKEEHDKFPTKMDRKGDIESFKKVVHSGHERGIGLGEVRDERHYNKTKE